jgi:hypothetical protein
MDDVYSLYIQEIEWLYNFYQVKCHMWNLGRLAIDVMDGENDLQSDLAGA